MLAAATGMTPLRFRCAIRTDAPRDRVTVLLDDAMERLCAHPGVLDAAVEADYARGEVDFVLTMPGATRPEALDAAGDVLRRVLDEAAALAGVRLGEPGEVDPEGGAHSV